MKTAFQRNEAFLADVRHGLNSKAPRIWWLGQSGFLILQNGRAVVLDPYLSDSLTRKYAATDKPHTRITEQVIDPAALGSLGVIDVITSSHNHTDHLDAETIVPLLDANPHARLVIPAANREFVLQRLAARFASRLVELDAGLSVSVAGLEIVGVAAAHPEIERDVAGRCHFLGYVIQWEKVTVYHGGDTMWHDGLVDALRDFKVDIALLPINGDRPERRIAGNLDGRQAAQLARAIGARCVIPCHYDMFEFNTVSPDEFAAECRKLLQPFRILQNGEGCKLP